MAGRDQISENTWADQWDYNNETEPSKQRKKQQHQKESKNEKKVMPKKLEEGFNKTKEGTSEGMKKVKDGASVGFSWIKDKFHKKT